MSIYMYLFYIGAVLAVVFLLLSIFLFFNFKIIKLVNDLSGRSSKKTIEKARKENTQTGEKRYKPSKVNMERGKITDKIDEKGNIISNVEINYGNVSTDKLDPTTALGQEPDIRSESTTILSGQADSSKQGTVVLGNTGAEETEVIGVPIQEIQKAGDLEKSIGGEFVVEEYIEFYESAEIIK